MVFSKAVFSWFQNRDETIDIINEALHVDAIETGNLYVKVANQVSGTYPLNVLAF